MKTISYSKFNFEDLLRSNTQQYKDKHNELIQSAPDIYALLVALLDVTDISTSNRSKIFTAIGYFLVPQDLFSEDEHGAIGYIDDILLAVFVIKEVENEIGFENIKSLYKNSIYSLEIAISSNLFQEAVSEYNSLFQEVLEYVGFQ